MRSRNPAFLVALVLLDKPPAGFVLLPDFQTEDGSFWIKRKIWKPSLDENSDFLPCVDRNFSCGIFLASVAFSHVIRFRCYHSRRSHFYRLLTRLFHLKDNLKVFFYELYNTDMKRFKISVGGAVSVIFGKMEEIKGDRGVKEVDWKLWREDF